MGNAVRMYGSSGIYFVRATTIAGRYLEPSRQLNLIIGGVLARAVRKYSVGLRGFAMTRTGITLLVRAERATLSDFMRFLLGNISRKVRARTAISGKLWSGRFQCEPVIEVQAELDCLAALIREALAETRGCAWPPLTCLPWLLPGSTRPRLRFYEWNRRHLDSANLRHVSRWSAAIADEETLELERIFAWRELDEEQVAVAIGTIVDGTRASEPRAKGASGCWASSELVRQQFVRARRSFRQDYARASRSLRAGVAGVIFPDHTFLPCFAHDPMKRKGATRAKSTPKPPRASSPAVVTASPAALAPAPVWVVKPRRDAAIGM